jgi:hypothetical protein
MKTEDFASLRRGMSEARASIRNLWDSEVARGLLPGERELLAKLDAAFDEACAAFSREMGQPVARGDCAGDCPDTSAR